MDSNSQDNELGKIPRFILAVISALISAAFIYGIFSVIPQIDITIKKELEGSILVLSFMIPFAAFFGVVAIQGLNPKTAKNNELMSVRGWRILAAFLFVIGLLGGLIGYWVSILIPWVMAYICMMKDEKFIQKLRNIGFVP